MSTVKTYLSNIKAVIWQPVIIAWAIIWQFLQDIIHKITRPALTAAEIRDVVRGEIVYTLADKIQGDIATFKKLLAVQSEITRNLVDACSFKTDEKAAIHTKFDEIKSLLGQEVDRIIKRLDELLKVERVNGDCKTELSPAQADNLSTVDNLRARINEMNSFIPHVPNLAMQKIIAHCIEQISCDIDHREVVLKMEPVDGPKQDEDVSQLTLSEQYIRKVASIGAVEAYNAGLKGFYLDFYPHKESIITSPQVEVKPA